MRFRSTPPREATSEAYCGTMTKTDREATSEAYCGTMTKPDRAAATMVAISIFLRAYRHIILAAFVVSSRFGLP